MGKGSCKEQGGERGGQTCGIETRMLERDRVQGTEGWERETGLEVQQKV